MKDWDDGPYPDYEWVKCVRCEGTSLVSPETINRENQYRYGEALKWYKIKLAVHNILKKIKLTELQLQTLFQYGYSNFKRDYVGVADSKTG